MSGTWPPRHIATSNEEMPAYGQRMVMGRAMQTLSNGTMMAAAGRSSEFESRAGARRGTHRRGRKRNAVQDIV